MGPLEKEVMELKANLRELEVHVNKIPQLETCTNELKSEIRQLDQRMDNGEKETIEIKSDIKSTNRRVDGLEDTLKEISDNTKWIKRTITKAGITTMFSLIAMVIVGFVTFYLKSL
jgi:chromosome segregation ATPase